MNMFAVQHVFAVVCVRSRRKNGLGCCAYTRRSEFRRQKAIWRRFAGVRKRAPSRKKRYPILFRNHPGVPDFVNFPKIKVLPWMKIPWAGHPTRVRRKNNNRFFQRFWVKERRNSENIFAKKRYTSIVACVVGAPPPYYASGRKSSHALGVRQKFLIFS